ncbi:MULTISPECIES: YncE family protein [unclassified Streptomyces]|uniref:YncE family protein n=1 Tax=unclassified Streptomyces TaxID=2593676 RepID=UPI0036E961C2
MRRPGLRAAVGVLVLLLLPLFGTSAPAAAKPLTSPTSTALPISYHADMAVDAVHRRLYIADIVTSSILVTDFDGTLVKTLKNKPGAADLVLSPDSRTLYVALRGGDAIAAIDTGTYREKARYATGAGTAPMRLALSGDTLWFSYGADWDSNIGSLRLSGTRPTVRLGLVPSGTWAGPPMLLSSPSAPGVVIAGEQYVTSSTVTVYDVSTGKPVVRTTQDNPGGIGTINDLAFSPDAATLFIVGGYPYTHLAFRPSDLTVTHTYPTTFYPNAAAVSVTGEIAAGIDNSYGQDIYLFQPGADTSSRVIDLEPGTGRGLRPHGLIWSPDGTRLFALTGESGANLALHVIPA